MSGGPDSLALLLLAHAALPGRIEAATVNHQLRPEAAREAAFVAETCKQLGIPHETLTIAVGAGNLQAEAREARYQALAQWMESRGIAMLATAHHADDQAETLLMRLNRGSGLSGLASIRPTRPVPGAQAGVCRPLLSWRKAELEAVVAGAGLQAVRDPSNDDPSFDRARVRAALRSAEWIDPVGLARSAALLGDAEAVLSRLVDESYERDVTRTEGGIELRPPRDPYVKVEVLRRVFGELGAAPSRSEISQCSERLESGQNASLAGILATPVRAESEENGPVWLFREEPPRRSN